jgi:SNF2 family DNA or RNA helicase
VVTLTVLTERLWDSFTVRHCLVIAPKNVAETVWTQECRKWDHLRGIRTSLVAGTARQRSAALRRDADLYVIGRDNLVWLMEQTGGELPFEMVVLDELSSFKDQKTKRWRSIRKAIQSVRYVIGLTGTPAPNGYLDLWPQIFLLDGGQRLGKTIGRYRDRYFTPGAHRGHIVYEYRLRMGAQAAIDRELSSLCLSMKSEDWLELPPTIYNTIPVRLDKKARETYARMEREGVLPLLKRQSGFETLDPNDPEALRKMTSAIRGDMAATLAGKLLQMANGAVYDDERNIVPIHDAKLDALAELADTSAGNSLLVFYAYEHDRDRILARFKNARVFRGQEDAAAWNRGEIPMLLCHPASAGHGLNLQQGGHIIVWFGLTWSLELYQQANARLPRPGQTHTVIVHHIVAEGTLDERVMQVMAGKNATQDALLEALKGYLNKEEN